MPSTDPPNSRDTSSSGGDQNGDRDDSDLDERLQQLKSKLDNSDVVKKHAENTGKQSQTGGNTAGVAQAFRLSSEFIAGVVVGAGMGYLVDTFFGTSPWGMIFFLLLGFAAAVLNVMRAAGMVAESQMRLKPAHDMDNQRQNDESDDNAKK